MTINQCYQLRTWAPRRSWWKLRFTSALALLLLTASNASAATFSDQSIEKFFSARDELRPILAAATPDPAAVPDPDAPLNPSMQNPLSSLIQAVESSDLKATADSAVQKHGFQDFAAWASFGNSLANAIASFSIQGVIEKLKEKLLSLEDAEAKERLNQTIEALVSQAASLPVPALEQSERDLLTARLDELKRRFAVSPTEASEEKP